MSKPESRTITGESRVTLALVISIFGGVGTLGAAWVSHAVATSVSQTEIANLKDTQNKSDDVLRTIAGELSEIKGIIKEMQRQDNLRRR